MLSTPTSAVAAGLQAVTVAAAVLLFGRLIAGAAGRRLGLSSWARWGLAVPAVVAFTAALMALHLATGGAVLSNPALTRGLTVATAVALLVPLVRSRVRARPVPMEGRPADDEGQDGPEERAGGAAGATSGAVGSRWGVAWAGAVVLVAVVLWTWPVFRFLPLHFTGDTVLHVGLASQLLNGEPTPAATVTGDIPNSYPWGYHALVAWLTGFTAGGRAIRALAPLHVLQVAGIALALLALGRQLTGRVAGGVAAVFLVAIGGSFGWRYPVGDPGLRPYHTAFFNLLPPFPRDVALLMLVAFLLLLVVGLEARRPAVLAAAGAVLGLAGLFGAESFFLGIALAGAAPILALPGSSRWRIAASLLLPAVAVYSVWLVPLLVAYVRLGGFVNITQRPPVTLAAHQILMAWGPATVLGVFGFARWVPAVRRSLAARVLLALLAIAAVLVVAVEGVPGALGDAFLALGRRHRYWPLLYLAVALLAAVGLTEGLVLLGRRRLAAAALTVAVVALALPSAANESKNVLQRRRPLRILEPALAGERDSILNVARWPRGRRCVAAVPVGLGAPIFAYTGYRLVLFVWPQYKENLARIRWRDIYAHIPGDEERRADNETLLAARPPGTWRRVVRKYGVDVVVAPRSVADSPALRALPRVEGTGRGGARYVVVRVGDCPL